MTTAQQQIFIHIIIRIFIIHQTVLQHSLFLFCKTPRECVHACMSEGVVYDPQTYVIASSPNYDLRHVAMSP